MGFIPSYLYPSSQVVEYCTSMKIDENQWLAISKTELNFENQNNNSHKQSK